MTPDRPFGVLEFLHWNHEWNDYKYNRPQDYANAVKLMQEAAVGWVRMDFLWEDIEPKQGEFNFTKYDYIVDLLVKNDLKILGLLDYTSPWAAGDGKWNSPPKDNQLFLDYVLQVIGRYRAQVKYWEVWNEPDSPIYWNRQDGLKSYCALLKAVYLAAKKSDADCKILNGGIANGLDSVRLLYENGAKEYFDILNLHFFENPLNPQAIKAVTAYPRSAHELMSRYGDSGKKIWLTEIGCPGVKSGIKTKDWWVAQNPDEDQQAAWLKNVYAELLKDGYAEKIFWAFLRDCKNHWENGVDYFGLVRWDFSPKPSYKAYQECSRNWQKTTR